MTVRGFLMQYWLSVVWVGLATYTLIVVIIAALTYSKPIKTPSSIGAFLVIGVIVALVRYFINGGGFKKEVLDKNTSDNFMLNVVLWGLQVAFLVVCWPFLEFFRQGRFLIKAYNMWKSGKILVDERGRALHAG